MDRGEVVAVLTRPWEPLGERPLALPLERWLEWPLLGRFYAFTVLVWP